MNAALDLFAAIGPAPSVVLVVIGSLVFIALCLAAVTAAQAVVADRLQPHVPFDVAVGDRDEVGSDQIGPLYGVRLTETHLHIHEEALRLRDLRFVKRYDNSLRVVDGEGRSHQVCQFTSPASPKVVALADALHAIVYPERRRPAPSLQLALRSRQQRRCPYCHDDLLDAEVECGGCGTGHHAECFRAHGACSILACGPHPTRGRLRSAG